MSRTLRIINGRTYDPANGVDGDVRKILAHDGKIVAQLPEDAQPRTIDATAMVVMPGGVEMHAHLASMPVNAARQIQSATGYGQVVPTAPDTGRLYALLGYTTAVEAAVAPSAAAHAHLQLNEMANLDTAVLVLMANHEGLIERIDQGDDDGAVAMIAELLRVTGGLGIKAVNPVAVAAWRRDAAKTHVDSIDDKAAGTKVSPRRMLEVLTDAQQRLGLPHPTHIHGPQLGEPGGVDITIEMIKALSGRRFHLAHLQYYAYGKTNRGRLKSEVERLLKNISGREGITADLGMVAYGPAFTATADLPLEYDLYRRVRSPGKHACFVESGNEDCFGLMPLVRQPTHPVHAMQWATGLELALLWDNPWQYALTVDHPNGGSFLNYPALIALLMNKPLRDEQLASANEAARQHTGLGGISREMTLNEIAVITRAAPAAALGLADKGHLGPGADADITIYSDDTADPRRMFESPRYVIKGGHVLVEDGQLRQTAEGERLRAAVDDDPHGASLFRDWWRTAGGYDVDQFGIAEHERQAMIPVVG